MGAMVYDVYEELSSSVEHLLANGASGVEIMEGLFKQLDYVRYNVVEKEDDEDGDG